MRACLFWTVFCAITQNLFTNVVADIIGYTLDPSTPLELTEANLKVLSFRILPNWVDMTLEYSQPAGVSVAQWFGIGFGANAMECTYAITFEPIMDEASETIIDVAVTERQLGNHEPGRELQSRLEYIETWIDQNPEVVIRSRLIRERVVPNNEMPINPNATNETEICSGNPYYTFPFGTHNISIIYAKGADGNYNISYHTQGNRHWGHIPLVTLVGAPEIDNQTGTETNITVLERCPLPFSLLGETYSERFDEPNVPRVCESCAAANDSYECTSLGNESTTCGCTNMDLIDASILFLIDGAGNQTDQEWLQFTWKILDGFVNDIMRDNTSAALDVNAIVYGGLNNPLTMQKLDWRYLNYLEIINPVPLGERQFSDLCNATKVAIDYLSNSTRVQKILITIPWQTPTDEVECLATDTNYSLKGIDSYTAKVFDEVDLSMVELAFEGYEYCTYLYQNLSEQADHYQEWFYVLAGISDFICLLTPQLPIITTTTVPNVTDTEFSLQLLMISQWSAFSLLANYSNNIEDLIEASYEAASNFTIERDVNFTIQIQYINSAVLDTPQPNETMNTVLITVLVEAFNTKIENLLIEASKTETFNSFLNFSFSLYFQDNDISVQVYAIDGQILNTTSTTTQVPQTSTTGVASTTSTTISPTSNDSKESDNDDVLPWMIAVIVLSVILLCFILAGICALCMRRRDENKDARTAGEQKQKNKEQGENSPMIVTAGETAGNNKYGNKVSQVPDRDHSDSV